jgi:type II restriction enzyme
MLRVDEAKEILRALGMPRAQTNDNAAYSFLAFANVGPQTLWADAVPVRLNPHGVLEFVRVRYDKIYAENTRETIRRQAIHQFVQAGILRRNPDAADLATNSPRTHYALSDEALAAIRVFGTPEFASAANIFLTESSGGLAERHARVREGTRVPVTLPDGREFNFSPGVHNQLQGKIISEFLPQFSRGAQILYLGDTDHKHLVLEADALRRLGVPITKHDKLPDVVAFEAERQWLFLIEAVTSHGPVSAKRHEELESVLAHATVGRVYVSAFLDFREFKRHAGAIAWETEVWIAEAPTHLLHYNGDRFFGPR